MTRTFSDEAMVCLELSEASEEDQQESFGILTVRGSFELKQGGYV